MENHEHDYRGSLDQIKDFFVIGWAADSADYDRCLKIELLDESEVIATTIADIQRKDLQNAGVGDGNHGYLIRLPENLFDGKEHRLTTRIEGHDKPFGPLSFCYDQELSAEVELPEGRVLQGQLSCARSPLEKEPVEVKIMEGKDCVARGEIDEEGVFEITLPYACFDGEEHTFSVLLSYPPVELAELELQLPDLQPLVEITRLEHAVLSGLAENLGEDFEEDAEVTILQDGNPVVSAEVEEGGRFVCLLPLASCDGQSHQFRACISGSDIESAEESFETPSLTPNQYFFEVSAALDAGEISIDLDDEIEAFSNEDARAHVLLGALLAKTGVFDHIHYQGSTGVSLGLVEAVGHFIGGGWEQGCWPMVGFNMEDYRALNPDLRFDTDLQYFLHYALIGRGEKRYFSRADLNADIALLRMAKIDEFTVESVEKPYKRFPTAEYYLLSGWRSGTVSISRNFDVALYLACYEDVRNFPRPPYVHFLKQKGKRIKEKSELGAFVEAISNSGVFDSRYYLDQLDGPVPEGLSEVAHYKLFGEKHGIDPSRAFSAEYYRRKYPDLAGSGLNLFEHYLANGKKEGRVGKLNPSQYIQRTNREFDPARPTILVVCHEASRTGAPILGLRLAEYFAQRANVICWVGKSGPLTEAFVRCSVAMIHTFYDHVDSVWLIRELKLRYDLQSAVANSACTVMVAQALHEEKVPLVALVHEYGDYMEKQVVQVLRAAHHVVFPAEGVLESARIAADKQIGQMTNNTHVRHQGRCIPPGGATGKEFDKDEILEMIGFDETTEKPIIVLGCGSVQMRKGVESFVEAARLVKAKLSRPVRFIWVGGGYLPDIELAYSAWIRSQIINSGLEREVYFFDETSDLNPFFDLADVFFLPSRLDPFPNVAIDAVSAQVPVVAFEKGTGFVDFIHAHPSVGTAVPYLDLPAAAEAICDYIEGRKAMPERSKAITQALSFPAYADFVLELCASAVIRQKAIADEAELIERSGQFNEDFFGAFRSDMHPILSKTYQYVDMWDKGVVLSKMLPASNEWLAAESATGTIGVTPFGKALVAGRSTATHRLLRWDEQQAAGEQAQALSVAIHLHLKKAANLAPLLERFTTPDAMRATLFVTIEDEDDLKVVESTLREYPFDSQVQLVPRRVREMGAFILLLQDALSRFDVVGHFHDADSAVTIPGVKPAPLYQYHADLLLGKDGRRVGNVLNAFAANSGLGLLFAESPVISEQGNIPQSAHALSAALIGRDVLRESAEYPACHQFWARTAALKPLLSRAWASEDFELTASRSYPSIHHALAKLLPAVCAHAGFEWLTAYNPKSLEEARDKA